MQLSPSAKPLARAARPDWRRLALWLLPGSAVVTAIPALDGLRGVATLLVMVFHAYHPDKGTIHYLSPLDALSYGHTGVQLFFVLSGFLLFLPYARWLFGLQPQPSTAQFYWRRLLRVGPAYWVNIVLIVLFANLSVIGLVSGLAHVVFLQNVLLGYQFQLNGVLWTMAVEVQFYALLPLLGWITYQLARRLPLALALGIVLGSCEAISILCDELVTHKQWTTIPFLSDALITSYSPSYWLGVFAVGMGCSVLYIALTKVHCLSPHELRRLRALATGAFVVGLGLALGVALFPATLRPHLPFKELSYGWFYGLLLIGILFGAKALRWPFETAPLRFIGHISYSLYLWHLYILTQIEPHLTMFTDHAQHTLVLFLLDALFALPLAYIGFQLIERPFFTLRRRAREQAPVASIRAPLVAMAQALRDATVEPHDQAAGWMGSHIPIVESQFPQVGDVIDGYRLERELGRSAHGVSFFARRDATGAVTWKAAMAPEVAVLKLLWSPIGLTDERALARFNDRFAHQTLELQTICGALIPSAAEVGAAQFVRWGGSPLQPYMIRAYVDGYSLAEWLTGERQQAPLAEVAGYVTRVAAALDYAHARGVAHGTLTLDNMLVSHSGDLLVTDFGIEELLQPLTRSLSASPDRRHAHYLAPGRFGESHATPARDIYSLSVALYALVCGRFPFDGATAGEITNAQRNAAPPSPCVYRPDLPARVEAVIVKALASTPKHSFATASALAAAFTAAVEDATSEKVALAGHSHATPFPALSIPLLSTPHAT
ncbi:MAG: acyltransferase family protein [Ktedonobacterales bacterium]